MGAFGAHAFKNLLNTYGKSIYQTAVLYQMFHSVALFVVGWLQHHSYHVFFLLAGWGFFTGIFLFSGSLYLLALTGIKGLGAITPIGGLAFLFGWACLSLGMVKI
jgi:uncharacterized membrane protein YgdD (TMEM256/DUF423 family)